MGAFNVDPSTLPPVGIVEDLVVCMRSVGGDGKFGDELGRTAYLMVPPPPAPAPGGPPNQPIGYTLPLPDHGVAADTWFGAVIAEAARRPATFPPATAPVGDSPPVIGDVVVFIHGYSNDPPIVMQRHRQLRKDLAARGYAGAVVTFDWPSGNATLGYPADRGRAHRTAPRLVDDLIRPFVARVRTGNCRINVHVLAHSMGAYLFQEAVDQSDEHSSMADVNWAVSQLVLVGADIDQRAIGGHGDGESMIEHCVRLTNYSNPADEVLKLSNVKRAGFQPRVGRVGLPADAPPNTVDVNCGPYFTTQRDPAVAPTYGYATHSWHVGDPVWTDDFMLTIEGNLDRSVFPTRSRKADGTLALQPAP